MFPLVTVTVPVVITKFLNVNVPELLILPPVMVIVPLVGIRDLPGLTVNPFETVKELVGCVEGVSDMVSPLKANVPELTMLHPVVAMVIMPAEGLKLADVPTVNAPLTVKELAVVTVAELAIERLLNINGAATVMLEPLPIDTVPELLLNVPEFEKLPDMERTAEVEVKVPEEIVKSPFTAILEFPPVKVPEDW